jgi:hypothetical protein
MVAFSPELCHPHPRNRGRAPGVEAALEAARRVSTATGLPAVGGVAVVLHGWGRSVSNVNLLGVADARIDEAMGRAGAVGFPGRSVWSLDGNRIELVNPTDFGPKRSRNVRREGVLTVALSDLIASKLALGLTSVAEMKHFADVVELIIERRLTREYASALPAPLRRTFRRMVSQIHGPRRSSIPTLRFWGLA